MSQIYMPRRKTADRASKPASAKGLQTASAPGMSLQSGGMGAQLEEHMQARFRQHFSDNQIPSAEREADRLSSGIRNAFTPEAVKDRMGEAMGADFSGVRFHTSSEDRSRAEAMGAEAYTTGRDVYFGQRGFDPGVAAHELVHTVQQGAVDSAVPTVSAPAGGVQMKKTKTRGELPLGPDLQEMFAENTEEPQKPKQGFFSKLGNKIKSGFQRGVSTAVNAVTKKYESFKRKHERAMDNLAFNREDFDKMGLIDKLKWMKSNPMGALAVARQSRLGGMFAHASDIKGIIRDQLKTTKNPFKIAKAIYQHSGAWGDEQKDQARQRAEERQNFMSGLVDEAKSFLTEYEAQNAPSGPAGAGGESQEEELPLGVDMQRLFGQREKPVEEGPGISSRVMGQDMRVLFGDEEGSLGPEEELPMGEDMQRLFGQYEKPKEEELPMGEDMQRLFGQYEKPKEEGSGISSRAMGQDMRVLFGDEEGSLGPEEELPMGRDMRVLFGDEEGSLGPDQQPSDETGAQEQSDSPHWSRRVLNGISFAGDAAEKAASVLENVNENAGIGLDIFSNSMGLVNNGVDFVESSVARHKLGKRVEQMKNTDAPGKQQERFRTLNQAYKMSKVNQVQSGTGAVSNMLGITSGALKLSGVGAPVAKALDYVNKGVSVIGGSIADSMGKQTRSDVVNEETSADAKIEAFKAWYKHKHNKELDDHDAKHAVLKAMGFESGKRREIFLSISKDRAHKMTEEANAGDMESSGIVSDMGVKKGSRGAYDEKDVAEKLGAGGDVDEELEKVRKSRAFGF